MARLRTFVCVIFLLCAEVSAQVSGDAILKKVEELYATISDYTVTLDIVANLERLSVPPMHVTMYFKKPDKIHFDAEGFALLPREAIGLNIGRIASRYSVESVEKELIDGDDDFKLTLKAKDENNRLRTLSLYVNPNRWTPDRIVSPLLDGRTMTALFQHQRVERRWVTSLLTVQFSSSVGDTSDANPPDMTPPPLRTQVPRTGSITIRYSNYRINTGLSDDVFERKNPAPQKQ